MRVAFAVLLLLHGIAHLVGSLMPWGLVPAPATPGPMTNAIFGGRVALGDSVARGLGVLWLFLAVVLVVSAVAFWRREPWAMPVVIGSTLASLAFCLVWWPATRIGVVVNVGLIALLLV